jgi:hypothetical protein
VPLIVSAEELALLAILSDHQQEMAVVRLYIQDLDLCLSIGHLEDLEELAVSVSLDIQPHTATRGPATVPAGLIGEFEPRSDAIELALEYVVNHDRASW